MNVMLKRSLAMLLTVCMLFSACPVSAVAEGLAEEPAPQESPIVTEPPVVTDPPAQEPGAPVEHQHAYEAGETLAPTCTADGYTVYTCACGDSYNEAAAALGHDFVEGVCAVCGEADPDYAAEKELSGEVRTLYFYNAEAWEKVYADVLFDEEEFADVLDAELKDEGNGYWSLEVAVEADKVVFTDRLSTDPEAAQRTEYPADINADTYYDLYKGQWMNYAAYLAMQEEAAQQAEEERKAAEAAAASAAQVKAVQDMIDALPATVSSEAQCDAVWEALEAIDEAEAALTEEQQAQLDKSKYDIALDAAAAFFNPEFDNSGAFAEADGWYWDGSTLYIKEGAITKAELYNALDEKYGSGSYKYATSKPSLGWDAGGTAVTSEDNGAITVSRGSAAVGKKGNTSWKDWSGWGANSSTNTFAVEYYYVPSVTVSGKDGVTVSNVPTKVIHGNNVAFTLSAAGEDGWVATVTNESGSQTVALSATASTAVTVSNIDSVNDAKIVVTLQKAQSYNVNVSVNPDTPWGTATVDVSSGIKDTKVTVTATPNSVSGAWSYSVAKIEVNGTAISGNTFKIGEADANVVVTFARSELEANSKPTLEINGYHTSTDYSARFDNIKAKVLSAVLKNGYTNVNDYNLHIWIDPIAGDARYFNWDDDSGLVNDRNLFLANPSRFPCDGFGDSVFKANLKVKIIDNLGRTVEATIAVTEERTGATVTPPSAVNGSFDTKEAFIDALKNVTVAYDNNNQPISANDSGLTLSATWDGNVATVTWAVTKDGASWLKNSGNLGTYTWNVSTYEVVWYDEDGTTVLDSQTLSYGSKPVYAGKATAELAAAKNDAQYTWSFDKWIANDKVAADGSITGAATYTASYTSVVNKYAVKFFDYDGTQIGETQNIEYGQAAVAPTATQEYKTNDKVYTFAGWDKAFDNVVEAIDVKAAYSSVTRYYTVIFQNWDGTELKKFTNLEYNQTPDTTGIVATKAAEVDENGVTKGTYEQKAWNVSPVTVDNKIYVAEFDYIPAEYTVTWTVNDETFASQTDDYGTAVTLPTGTPADYVDANGTNWTFDRWDAPANLGTIAGDKEYVAVFKQSGNDAKIIHADNTETYCKDLVTALEAADAGETVVMLTDATVSAKITVAKNISIDGNNHSIIANHGGYILETSSDCTIQNVTLDTNNKAKGVKIASGNVVFDNVTIPNSNKSDAITVSGTLTLKNYFKVGTSYSCIDARNGVVNAVPGTVFDFETFRGNVSPASSDLKGAVDVNGELYFCAYDNTSYYRSLKSVLSLPAGLTLLKNSTVASNWTVSGSKTIDLNGNTLSIAEGKTLTVTGDLVLENAGTVEGSIIFNDTEATLTGPEGLDVKLPEGVDTHFVVYENGVYRVETYYTITWVNGEDTTTTTVAYGEMPVAPEAFKSSTEQYHYIGSWGELSKVTGPATYTATFTAELRSYAITWVNGNETTTTTVAYGTMPVAPAAVKADKRDADGNVMASYTKGTWGTVVPVSGEASYTATFTEVPAEYTVSWIVDGKTTTETYVYGAAPTFKGSTDKATVNYNKYTFTGWDVAPAAVVKNVSYTAQYAVELLASNGTVKINGYWEGKGSLGGGGVIFDTLKADTLKAAGISGNAGNYTVVYVTRLGNVDLDNFGITGKSNFFLAVEVPESGRQVIITDKATGASKTVTMKIEDSRESAGLNDLEVTDVKVFDGDTGLNEYVNSLANGTAVNPKGVNVSISLTEGSWPPAEAGVDTKLVYTVKYADSADYIGDEAKLSVWVQAAYNNCTVVGDADMLTKGSLTVSPSNDNKTVAGNDLATITVTPNSAYAVESISVSRDGVKVFNFNTSDISYSNGKASVSFRTDGSVKADEYVVSVSYVDKTLTLKEGQTIVYCVDDKAHTYDLQKLVFDAIFGGSSAPMTKDNVVLKFKYGHIVVDLWADVSEGPTINLNGISHKFGESGVETIKLTYSDDKYGSIEQTVDLNVFDSCYSSTVSVETVTNGANATIKTQYNQDSRKYLGVDYFKQGTELTATFTPDGDLINSLEQLYNGTYSESMAYIKSVTVYDKNGNKVDAALERGQGKLSIGNILQGVNPMMYNAAVTFTTKADEKYNIVVEYGILELERKELSVQMPMYKGGNDYAAEVPSAQEIINAVLGEAYAAQFLASYGGAFTVEFSTDLVSYKWTEVSDDALLALNDGATVRVRITWKPVEGDKTYYPVAQQANMTVVDLRTATTVAGEIPDSSVNFLSEDKLIAELKEKMGLGINADSEALEGAVYTVSYTLNGNETDGLFADVTVVYDGSPEYKPTSKTFKNVPVANRPDDATIKVTIQNASDLITNNDNTIMSMDPATGIYTVIGNGSYNFKFTPVTGKAIERATVNGAEVELSYSKGVASFSMLLEEKQHYDVVVETVDSVWAFEDERVYEFAYGVMEPNNADIVDAAVKAPSAADIDYEKVDVKYMARAEGKVPVTLPNIDLGFTVIELGSFDIDLGELWLEPGATVTEYDVEKLVDDLVNEVIDKVSHGQLAATGAVDYITNKLKGLTLGAHEFGASGDGSTETIRVSYVDDKYNLAQEITDVTIHDYRAKTEIAASDCSVSYGYSLAQLVAASGATVMSNGVAVGGVIETSGLYLHAKNEAQQITLKYAGDANYQPSETTINVTVNKAACAIDYDSQIVTYGEPYDLALAVSPVTLPDGTTAEIDRIEMMIGLEMNKLLDVDFEDKEVGLNEAVAFVQLRLPESIRNLPLVGQYLQGEFSLGEFTNLINGLSDSLGIDEGSMDILNQVVEAITGVTDNLNIKVIIRDEDFHPSNIGVYIAGAVTVDSDFETAYTADYLIIAPNTIQAELAWDYTDENSIITLPSYVNVKDRLGAHVVETETMTGDTLDAANGHIKYLVLGISDDSSDFLSTDVYGNIKANIWTSNEAISGNGAYVQIAYMLNWGNEIYYAVPIVRSFVIVPEISTVTLLDQDGVENDQVVVTFNNQPQSLNAKVETAAGVEIINTYKNSDDFNNEYLHIYYAGIQTNGKLYEASTEAPVHAGVYLVTATFGSKDEAGDVDAIGADISTLVILPAETDTVVDDKIVKVGTNVNPMDMVTVNTDSGVTMPDTTVITAKVASNGTFSEIGWDAIEGNLNVDFPVWVDELMAEYFPGVKDGLTADEFSVMINSKLPALIQKLSEEGLSSELTNVVGDIFAEVTGILSKIPENTTLTFNETGKLDTSNVGAYLIAAVVTDSDHIPSADYGILLVTPDVEQVYLKWNYEDVNGVWTRELLEHVDMKATAYNDRSYTDANDNATAKITYKFVSVDEEGNVSEYGIEDSLPNGAYVQMAYIELELDGKIIVSDMIARPIVLIPNTAEVVFVDENGNVNNDRRFVYDAKQHSMQAKVTVAGKVITPAAGELVITYMGVRSNGQAYKSTIAPRRAGVYTVIATYASYDDNGNLISGGAAVGAMVIEPAQSTISVTGGVIPYDGEGHGVTVESNAADITLISGMARVSDAVSEVGFEAIEGNLNIDFPVWLDNKLSQQFADAYANGVSADDVIFKFNQHKDALVELGMNAEMIAEIVAVLEKVPNTLVVTFNDDVTYSEPGVYLWLGIVTDSDYIPSYDTGLLVIRKEPMVLDMLDTTVTYNGEGQFVEVNNPKNADYVTIIVDRANNIGNVILDPDLSALADVLEEALGRELPQSVNVAELHAAVESLLAKIEGIETLPVDIKPVLTQIRDALAQLPQSGIVYINGEWLPTNVGEYEFYGASFSNHYQTNLTEGVLTIIPAPIEVVVNDQEITYGDELPELTYEAEGLAEGDSLDVSVSVVDYSGDAGEYVIKAVVAENSNYEITVVDGTLTVNKKELTEADISLGEALTYNGTEQTQSVVVGEEVTYTVSGNTGTDAGEYTLTVSGTGNYSGTVTKEWTIAKAEVTVSVADKEITYGDELPELTYEAEGLVEGESLEISVSVVDYSGDAGEYVIKAVVAENSNYEITVEDGTLTVNKKELTEADISLGEALTYNGTEQTQSVVVGEEVTYTVSGNTGTDAGEYTLTVTGTGNYSGSVTKEWTIAKAEATVTIDNLSVKLGEAMPELADVYTVDGLVDGDTITVSVTCEAENTDTAGTYVVTAAIDNAENYVVSVVDGTLTVVDIQIAGDELELDKGDEEQIVITVEPMDGVEITYSSDDETVVTVDENGNVIAVGDGDATVTVTVKMPDGTEFTETITVSVSTPTTDITADVDELEMKVGEETKISVTVEPEDATDKTVTWTSSDETVVTVDENGNVIAVGEGTAVITVTTADGNKVEIPVTVEPAEVPATAISIEGAPENMQAGDTAELIAKIEPEDSTDKVLWKSSDETVATVDENGNVIAIQAGTVTITAYIEGNEEVFAEVEITVGLSIVVTLDSISVKLGDAMPNLAEAYTVEGLAEGDSIEVSVSCEAENTDVAGEYAITATIVPNPNYIVNVIDGVLTVVDIQLESTELELDKGDEEQLVITVEPMDGVEITYSSDDETVVTVDENGNVIAVGDGDATVTVTVKMPDGTELTETITVSVSTPTTDITADVDELVMEVGEEKVINVTVEPEDATDKTVTWTSSDETVVTVDENGNVIAVGEGTAVITVTTADGNKVEIPVTVEPAEVPATAISIEGAPDGMQVGDTAELVAKLEPEDSTDKVLWKSSDETVATVDENGKIIAVGNGNVTITAYIEGNEDISAEVEIKVGLVAIDLSESGLVAPGDVVEVDGVKYPVEDGCLVWVESTEHKIVMTYKWGTSESTIDPHGITAHYGYPTNMYVWYLSTTVDEAGNFVSYKADRIAELDDFFTYKGTSIRMSGNQGIRIITAINSATRAAMLKNSLITHEALSEYKLVEYGTMYKWADGTELIYEAGRNNRSIAYSVETGYNAVFATVGSEKWFTGMLTGLDKELVDDELYLRPYMLLRNEAGEEVVIYGGTLQRNIGYVALQNRDYKPNKAAADFIWDIIYTVYGEDFVYEG